MLLEPFLDGLKAKGGPLGVEAGKGHEQDFDLRFGKVNATSSQSVYFVFHFISYLFTSRAKEVETKKMS
jgi:hypothetical protein